VLYTICHFTTVHEADDVRIFYKECVSLSKIKNYKVVIAASGNIPKTKNITHYRIPKARTYRPLRILISQLIALRLVIRLKADVWHIHDPELLPAAALMIFLKRRVIWDSHEDYFRQFVQGLNYRIYVPRSIRPIVKCIVESLLLYIDKNAAGIVCATSSMAEKYVNKNTVVVGNEVVLNEFKESKPKFINKTVVYTGQPSSHQCYREIVEAISKIPDIKLIVACREFNQNDMSYSIAALSERFQYLGWLDRNKLSELFSNSSLGLVTYSNSSNHQDNQPNKFYEFCAAGLPILATPTRSNKVLIENSKAGILATGFDSESILLALIELFSSEVNWLKHSNSGKNWVKKNGNWANSEIALHEMYLKVLIG
jgi:glycosyltransferase involved in cell wall biosynthesis